MITDRFPRWGDPCSHPTLVRMKHWWYSYQCDECGKKLCSVPYNEFWEVIIKDE